MKILFVLHKDMSVHKTMEKELPCVPQEKDSVYFPDEEFSSYVYKPALWFPQSESCDVIVFCR
jgi:hypothetical protein